MFVRTNIRPVKNGLNMKMALIAASVDAEVILVDRV